MANAEYPDLPFVPPRAFGRGRDGHSVQYLVIHYTAGSERSTSAEDGAAYDQRRTDGVSTHYFVDQNSVVQCVYTWDRANAAFHYGNRKGIQYELCGTVQTRAQWLDPASDATLTNAAWQAARDCARYGLPVRRLSLAQMRAGEKGICGHHDVTLAYGLGDHTDPGAEFPWDVFLARVANYLDGGSTMALTWDDLDPTLKDRFVMVAQMHEWLRNAFTGKEGRLGEHIPDSLLLDWIRATAEGVTELQTRPAAQVVLTPADRTAIVDELYARLEPRLRQVVDEELDEQSRAGADADLP